MELMEVILLHVLVPLGKNYSLLFFLLPCLGYFCYQVIGSNSGFWLRDAIG